MRALTKTVASLACLAEHEELELAIIFGSCATGRTHRDSDLDIAVFPRNPLNPAALQSLADQLAVASGRPIDLVDLTYTNGTLLRQILRHGKVLFSKRPAILGNLNERLLDWQADFEPAQRAILTAQRARFLTHDHGS
jgi:predicted nucleotidyltransferase